MKHLAPFLLLLAACAGTSSQTVVSGTTTAVPGVGTVDDVDVKRTTTTQATTTTQPPTTTSPSTTKPQVSEAVQRKPEARTIDCAGWGGVLATHFRTAARAACSVMMCESQGNPRAYNPSGASGLFQVMPLWADDYQRVTGVPYYDGRFDGTANIRFAAWLHGQSGTWSHWVCKP